MNIGEPAVRKVITIDEEKCDGCGLCVPGCAEGAIEIVDGRAKLVSDVYCDGLGACLGHCPQGAITVEERAAAAYDEREVQARLARIGRSTAVHLTNHGAPTFPTAMTPFPAQAGGCPGSRTVDLREHAQRLPAANREVSGASELRQWPVKIDLVNPQAPYFQDADLLVAADCVPFAHAAFHADFLKGRCVVIGCPKFADPQGYSRKLAAILSANRIRSITALIMEVPCCYGLAQAALRAVAAAGAAGRGVEVKVVGIDGAVKELATR